MRILWLVNIPLPEVSDLMNKPSSYLGGWLVNSSKYLSKKLELHILFPNYGEDKYTIHQGEGITYYGFRPIASKSEVKVLREGKNFSEILEKVQPDLVHIYGSEMSHSSVMVNICNQKDIKVVVSIQGLVSIIAEHTLANLPYKVIHGYTLRNIIKRDNIIGLKKIYDRQGKLERKLIKNAQYVIGRTTWDKACVLQINPHVTYFHCDETLRESFYKGKWDINTCEKKSIFLSQAHYPIKGLHFLIKALPIIIEKFPETKVYISGKDFTKSTSFFGKFTQTYYEKYIKRMIKKYNLQKYILFLGPLDEKKMHERFLTSNVFLSSSTIENESNSVSEARILGVPVVASYVGGVIDRIDHGVDGYLFQHDAYYMLAHYICQIFENDKIATEFSSKSRERAIELYDVEKNNSKLINIYKSILSNDV
ncbi:glycosyltransferase family 4 protein [Metasolibacillus fluoroglycofenilyticus]|uniref:glycosyltransferase family 4 protein n=1 Tax=Metasolibacillus fluoroglycofenilyticus TaxID=1239396 RepID=UPI000D36ED4A|nr:glycosyltransferase [Metasolibacillus fluoroglycofenilyticus]